ncbi:MAG: ACT domain-containing protein [Firmicutes bacterium]|nr:ACT domain-containing protein [Bacillota bacterium]
MKAVITVIGKDRVGILASVSGACAKHNVNVLEVTQNILQGLFSMIMVVDVTNADLEIDVLAQEFGTLGKELGMDIRFTRTELYDAMHHI